MATPCPSRGGDSLGGSRGLVHLGRNKCRVYEGHVRPNPGQRIDGGPAAAWPPPRPWPLRRPSATDWHPWSAAMARHRHWPSAPGGGWRPPRGRISARWPARWGCAGRGCAAGGHVGGWCRPPPWTLGPSRTACLRRPEPGPRGGSPPRRRARGARWPVRPPAPRSGPSASGAAGRGPQHSRGAAASTSCRGAPRRAWDTGGAPPAPDAVLADARRGGAV
jgi:hypothetical protein